MELYSTPTELNLTCNRLIQLYDLIGCSKTRTVGAHFSLCAVNKPLTVCCWYGVHDMDMLAAVCT